MKKLIVVVLVLLMVGLVSGSISSVDNDKAVDYKLIEKANSGDRPYGAPLIPEITGKADYGGDNEEENDPQWKNWTVEGWEIMLYEDGDLYWWDSSMDRYRRNIDGTKFINKDNLEWPVGPVISEAEFAVINKQKPLDAPNIPSGAYISSIYQGKFFVIKEKGWIISYDPVNKIMKWEKDGRIYTSVGEKKTYVEEKSKFPPNSLKLPPIAGGKEEEKDNKKTGWTIWKDTEFSQHKVFGKKWVKDGAIYIERPDGTQKYISAPKEWANGKEEESTFKKAKDAIIDKIPESVKKLLKIEGTKVKIVENEFKGKKILMVGDSHSVGMYGKTLRNYFYSAGGSIDFYAVEGSRPSWWLNVEDIPSSYKSHPRTEGKGYFGNFEKTKKKTPYIGDLLKEKPNVVIISLGSNFFGTGVASDSVINNEVKKIVEKIHESGADECYWVGPPNGPNKVKVVLSEVHDSIKKAIEETHIKCELIDSRKFTGAFECVGPQKCPGNAHFDQNGNNGVQLAKNWATGVYHFITKKEYSSTLQQAGSDGNFFTPVSDGSGGQVQVNQLFKPLDQKCQDINKCKEIDRVWEQMRSKLSVSPEAASKYWVPKLGTNTGTWETFERLYVTPVAVTKAKSSGATLSEKIVGTETIKTAKGKDVYCMATVGTPEQRALLDMISVPEGGNKRYNVRLGGAIFNDMSGHPGAKPIGTGVYPDFTGAAGRYQFTLVTYNGLKTKQKQFKTGFGPKEQDKAAIELITNKKNVEISNQDIINAYNAGNLIPVLDKLAVTWAGIPYSKQSNNCATCGNGESYYEYRNEGRPQKTSQNAAQLLDIFNACYQFHKGAVVQTTKLAAGERICNSVTECKPICEKKESYGNYETTADRSQTVSKTTGIIPNGIKVFPELLEPLKKAGELANKQGYSISLSSGFRTVKHQIEIACPSILNGNFNSALIAYPGGSNHGTGSAIDLQLIDSSGTRISGSTSSKQCSYSEGNLILANIMIDAGWKRLKSEAWHFEYPANSVEGTRTVNAGLQPTGC